MELVIELVTKGSKFDSLTSLCTIDIDSHWVQVSSRPESWLILLLIENSLSGNAINYLLRGSWIAIFLYFSTRK